MKKAHFIGICGVGMSATAKLLQEQGWVISGSDEEFYPPISLYLKEHHLPCQTPYSPTNLPVEVDLIVIGKHVGLVPDDNQEVKAAFQSGIPIKSFPEVLQQLTKDHHNLVVAGSFGKSTCAILTAWTLFSTGKDPSYFLGALSPSLPSNAHLGLGPYFVLEGDEYPSSNWDPRPKFLYYNPRSVLLISVEHDHFNVFPTIESYLQPYIELLKSLNDQGLIIACQDGENVERVLREAGRKAITYSVSNKQANWWAEEISYGEQTAFNLYHQGKKLGRLSSHLLGEHNVQNMLGVAAWLLEMKAVTFAELRQAFQTFKGVRRRLELKTAGTAIPVYEDFGSSRSKALAGLKAIRQQFPHHRLIVIFEPHTFGFRNRNALPWYDDLFAQADLVYIFSPPQQGAATHQQLTQEEIVERVTKSGTEAYPVKNKKEIVSQLAARLRKNQDIILIETSGDLGGAIPEIAAYVQQRFQP